MAAAAARRRPSELVHVGDDVVTDLRGALDAGYRAVLLTRAGRQRKPEELEQMPGADATRWREVASLDEAVQVILQWQREGTE